jgi:hypothetical protein
MLNIYTRDEQHAIVSVKRTITKVNSRLWYTGFCDFAEITMKGNLMLSQFDVTYHAGTFGKI